jgi:hypothetical protein
MPHAPIEEENVELAMDIIRETAETQQLHSQYHARLLGGKSSSLRQ